MPTKRAGTPYREAPPTEVHACPLCDVDLAEHSSPVCPGCGLWWMLPGDAGERVRAVGAAVGGARLQLPLRCALDPGSLGVALAFGALCACAAFIILAWTDIARGPLTLPLLSLGLVSAAGLLTAVCLGAACGLCVAQLLLRALVPARLVGDASTLRLRVWPDQDGLLGGFRRTDVTVPREHVTGVFVRRWTSGGGARLRLEHASGLAFDLSWQEAERDVARQGEVLAAWLRAPAD
jgi:hypothetical protein